MQAIDFFRAFLKIFLESSGKCSTNFFKKILADIFFGISLNSKIIRSFFGESERINLKSIKRLIKKKFSIALVKSGEGLIISFKSLPKYKI